MEPLISNKESLYQKVLKIMSKVDWVKKTGYNSFHKYNYVTESDIVEYCRKLLVEEGLVMFNNVVEYQVNGDIATVVIEYTLCDVDSGESLTSRIVGQGQDKGDKAFYKAYAGATKYFLMKTFLIPTGDDPEGDIRTDKEVYGKDNGKKAPAGGSGKQSKVQLENQINSLLMQLTQNGYQGSYVYQMCKTQIGKDFNQLSELAETELISIRDLLSNEIQKVTG